MFKKALYVAALLLSLSCNYIVQKINPIPTLTPFPTSTEAVPVMEASSTPELDPVETATATEDLVGTEPFIITRVKERNGELMTQLAVEVETAKRYGLIPVIEFEATWCPACQAIAESIELEDKRMMKAIDGVYLIKADVDDWGWEHEWFPFEYIPIFFKLDEKGFPTGDVIGGESWDENLPENFAPVLDDFFHGG